MDSWESWIYLKMYYTRSDMLIPQIKSGFANIDNAKIYYETAGKGIPLVMIHAGVADSRQWNN